MSEPRPTLRARALKVTQFLFVLTFGLFFLVASALVLGQLLGTVLAQPALVSAASHYLLVPAVSLASTFGVIAFLGSYLREGGSGEQSS